MLQSVKYNGDVIAHNSRVGLDGGTVESLENLNDFSEVTRSINQPLLLDYVPNAAAAYSVRKLRSAYTGSAIRVRRAFDNTEQDIGFDANGNLNTTALTNFVNGESTLPADYGSGAVAAYSLRYVSSTYSGPVVRVRRSSDNTEQNFTPTEINDGTLTSFVGSENLLLYSEELAFAVWTKRAEAISSVNTNAANSPIETLTADRINFILQADQDFGIQQFYSAAVAGETYSSAIWLKGEGSNIGKKITIRVKRASGGSYLGNDVSYTLTGEWVKVVIPPLTLLTSNTGIIFIISSNEATSVLAWGAQLNSGSTLKEYVATTGVIVGEGYVTTWYDQRGSNNAVQSTAAHQPKIVDKGGLILDNGRASVDFDGVNDFLNLNGGLYTTWSVFSYFRVKDSSWDQFGEIIGAADRAIIFHGSFGGSGIFYDDSVTNYNTLLFKSSFPNKFLLFTSISNGTTITSYSNSIIGNTTTPSGGDTELSLSRLSGNFGGIYLGSRFFEVVIYPTDQSPNRANIEFGINNFYNIYSVSKDGFVTTWYDQSGSNNNAVQPTASSQPQIVSSGNTIFENGRVAVKFDGVDDILINANNISMISAFTVFTLYNVLSTAYPYLLSQPYNTNAVKMIGYLGASWGNSYRIFAGTNLVNNLSYTQGKQEVLYGLFNGVNSQIKVSNTQPVLGTAGTNNNTNGLVIGGTLTNLTGTALNGDIQEIIIFSSNQSSKRKLLESEINKYYNIYRPTANVSVYNKQPYTTDDMSQFISNISTNFNYDQSLDVNTFGDIVGTFKWLGGVLAPNGRIYGIPHNSSSIVEINPVSKTTITFGNFSGSTKWGGGVLAPNGKIYAVPFSSTTILEIDPIKRTATTFGSLIGNNKWLGGVLAPNGKIYCIPADSTTVLEIDPITRTTTTFGTLDSTSYKWFGGVLAPNGKIYCIPFNATNILEIDPVAKTTTTFGSITGSSNWYGGFLVPNGKIYGVPYNSTSVLEINPSTQSVSTFGSFIGNNKWVGGVLAPNGNVYCIPRSATTILEINPRTNATATFGNLTGTDKWGGTVLGTNGEIYGIPLNSTTVLEILSPVTGLDNNIPLSRFLNKF